MIDIKSEQEIRLMQDGGKRLRAVLDKVISNIRPGVSEVELNRIAEEEIQKQGGEASFKLVPGYSWAICVTVNDEVVNGIPGNRILEEGDVVGIDVGIFYKGFHTDLSTTVIVGKSKDKEIEKFLEVGRQTLEKAIKQAKVGNYIGDISQTIQEGIETEGYKIVKVLTGHGVGRELHEEPNIPGFLRGKKEKTAKIKAGMTLAIEVIYNQESDKIVLEDDGWTISTWDGKISGLFEETVAVTKNGPLILTR